MRVTAETRVRARSDWQAEACPTLCRQHARQQCLRFALDGAQMVFAGEALRVELVDVFGAGGTGGEPSARGGHFQSAKSSAVAGRGGQHGKLNKIRTKGLDHVEPNAGCVGVEKIGI